jgi:predicted phage-related endonuclease
MKKIEFDTEEQWLAYRRRHITSTDVSVLAGLNLWETPLSIYVAKVQGVEKEVTDQMILGQALQRGIADAYRTIRAQREGKACTLENYEIMHSPQFCVYEADDPRFAASWDCFQSMRDVSSLLEIKSTGSHPDEPYPSWLCQVQWEMYCSDFSECTIAAACGGNSLEYWDIKRDDDAIQLLVALADEFWERVEEKNPPPAAGDTKSLARLFARVDPSKQVQFDGVDLDRAVRYKALGDDIASLIKERDRIKGEFQERMGEAELGYLPDGGVVSWQLIQKEGYEVKPSTYRMFKITPPRVEKRRGKR